MNSKKMPPREKVFEAWTAIADNRIELHDGYATMSSSDGTKAYTIRWDGNIYASDDNATYWRGYPGYPVIAVLMLQGKLPFDFDEAEKWKGVSWKTINTKYKNDYAAAVKEVSEERHIDLAEAYTRVDEVMKALEALDIVIKRTIPKTNKS